MNLLQRLGSILTPEIPSVNFDLDHRFLL